MRRKVPHRKCQGCFVSDWLGSSSVFQCQVYSVTSSVIDDIEISGNMLNAPNEPTLLCFANLYILGFPYRACKSPQGGSAKSQLP